MKTLLLVLLLSGCVTQQDGLSVLEPPEATLLKALENYVLSTGYKPKPKPPRTTTYVR